MMIRREREKMGGRKQRCACFARETRIRPRLTRYHTPGPQAPQHADRSAHGVHHLDHTRARVVETAPPERRLGLRRVIKHTFRLADHIAVVDAAMVVYQEDL